MIARTCDPPIDVITRRISTRPTPSPTSRMLSGCRTPDAMCLLPTTGAQGAALEHAEHPRRSLPRPDPHDPVFSAELFNPAGESRILHRGRLYRLRVARRSPRAPRTEGSSWTARAC